MKFVQLGSVLLMTFCIALFAACKKDDKPAPGDTNPPGGTPEDTVPKVTFLTKVQYYGDLSDTANNSGKAPKHLDSLIYNEKKQLVKVLEGPVNSPIRVDTFIYNDAGKLVTVLLGKEKPTPTYTFTLKYIDNRLDSIIEIEYESIMNPGRNQLKVNYDDNGRISQVTSIFGSLVSRFLAHGIKYTRENDGRVKSFELQAQYLEGAGGGGTTRRTITPSDVSPANISINAMPEGYRLLMVQRENATLNPMVGGQVLCNFLAPQDKTFGSGAIDGAGRNYAYPAIFNADSTLRTLQYVESNNGDSDEVYGIRFHYNKQ